MTKFADLLKAGYSPEIHTCYLESGELHMFIKVDGWALDNRFDEPVRESRLRCTA